MRPGKGNNAYIFPGVGLGAMACEATHITDEMFLASAKCLAGLVGEDDLKSATLFPPLNSIRNASLEIAVAVAEEAYRQGVANLEKPQDLKAYIRELMYDPSY